MLTTFFVSKRKTISPEQQSWLLHPGPCNFMSTREGGDAYVHFTLNIYYIVHCVQFKETVAPV